MDYLSLLGKLASSARAAGLGRIVSLFRDIADNIWMKCGHLPLKVMVDGLILSGFYRHRSFLASLLGGYELFSRTLFIESLRPGMVVVDGGAHIGLYSLIASRKVGNAGKVLAIEPDPCNFGALLVNIKTNHANNIVALRKALSAWEGRTPFYSSTGTIGSSLFKRSEFDARLVNQIEVETTTVDQVLAGLDLSSVLIKLDLEGAEPLAIQGMRETIKRASSAMVFVEMNPSALHAAGYVPETLIQALQEIGLEIFFIDEKSNILLPVDKLADQRKANLFGQKRTFERQVR